MEERTVDPKVDLLVVSTADLLADSWVVAKAVQKV